jgi:hypothetical protein
MTLKDNIKQGGGATGTRLVIYADTKAGKTTTASQAPSPIFLGTDDGFRRLAVSGYDSPTDWPAFIEQVKEAVAEGPGEGYKTLVIDTINGVADLCAEYVCEKHFQGLWSDPKKGFLAWGGHQGWNAVSEEMKQLFPLFDELVDQGWWVIFLAHQKVEKVSDPIEGDFDRYSPAVHRNVWGRIAAWADVILRIAFDKGWDEDKSGKRRVVCDGTRVLRCSASSAEVAGTRAGYELPATMPLAWSEIEDRLGGTDDDLIERLNNLWIHLTDKEELQTLSYLGIKTQDDLADAPVHKIKTMIGRLAERGEV